MQLIVLGMHRSGTSVLARILNLMGAYFGPEGISTGANKENPKGFWERRDVRAINDGLLHEAGCDWNRVARFDAGKLPSDAVASFESRASKLVFDLDAHRPWFIKEPRLCLTLPLWRELLELPIAVHIFRHPVEVAASLLTRNQMPMAVGLALWEAYVSSALAASAELPGVVVSHHKLMTSPVSEVGRLYEELRARGVSGLRMPSELELGAFIDPALYRERNASGEHRQYADAPQISVFETLEAEFERSRESFKELSALSRQTLSEYESELPPLQIKSAVPELDVVKLKERVLLRDQENRLLKGAVADLEIKLRSCNERSVESSIEIGSLRSTVVHGERETSRLLDQLSILRNDLKERDEDLLASAGRLSEAKERVGVIEAESEGRARELDELAEQLVVARQQADEMHVTLESERQSTRTLRDELSKQKILVEQKDSGFEILSQELRQARFELSKSRASLDQRFREIAYLSRRVLEGEKALKKHASERAELEGALAARTRELESLRGSRVWRWSRPLRTLTRRLAVRGGQDLAQAIAAIDKEKLFDRAWYLRANEDVARSGMEPLEHYLRFGAQEGRDPGANFSTASYLKRNPDVLEAGINPLLHYAVHGKKEGRLPK